MFLKAEFTSQSFKNVQQFFKQILDVFKHKRNDGIVLLKTGKKRFYNFTDIAKKKLSFATTNMSPTALFIVLYLSPESLSYFGRFFHLKTLFLISSLKNNALSATPLFSSHKNYKYFNLMYFIKTKKNSNLKNSRFFSYFSSKFKVFFQNL